MALAAVSADKLDIEARAMGTMSPLVRFVVHLIVLIGLLFAIFKTQPGGIAKYAAFGAFAIWIGQTLKPLLERLKVLGKTRDVLIMTTGVFVGMMALGFYDNQNLIGFGGYLMAGLLGLIFAQLLIMALATPAERKSAMNAVRIFGIALFAVLTAFDVQQIKESAKACARMKKLGFAPDYPVESIGLFLDYVNLFSKFGGLESD